MFGEILVNKNLTIKEITDGAGIPRSTIADLISGKTAIDKMSAGNLYKLSKYLNLNMEDLFIYCCLPKYESPEQFVLQDDEKIIAHGFKRYMKELAENNLVETTYALGDEVRFQKYIRSVRDFHKYRRLEIPERYVAYLSQLKE